MRPAAHPSMEECGIMKKQQVWILAIVLSFSFSCGKSGQESTGNAPQKEEPKEPYKIGAIFSITGPASNLGEPERNTAVMIAEQINKTGGINGHPVELIVEDNEGDNTKAVVAANKLIKQDGVCVVIGPSRSDNSMAVKPVADENQIPLISCAAAEDIVKPLSKWVFKTPQNDSDCVRRIYEHMNSAGIKKIAVITATEGFGKAGRDQLQKLAPEFGITIVADVTYDPKDTDMTAQLTQIRGTDAQAVVNWSIVPAQSIVPKNMKQLGMTIPLFQSHGFGNIKYAEAAGDAAEGIIFPAGALLIADSLPDEYPRKFLLQQYKKDYESKFNAQVSTFGGHAYDAMQLAIMALEEVGADPAKIRDYLETVKDFDGTAGRFNYSPEDHCGLDKNAFELITVKGGKFTLYKP